MARLKSRMIAVLTVIAMVAMLLPAMPASAAIDAGGGQAGPPLKFSEVDAHVTPRGVDVKVINLAADVTGIDVYRSATAGELGSKLNAEPVASNRYLDETAAAGKTYFYTVKVAGRDSTADAGRFYTADELPQVSVKISADSKAVEARQAPAPNEGPRDKAAKAGEAPVQVKAASAAQVSAMATTIGSAGQVTTLTGGATWTTAMSPIFVRGDVVVPAGKTLTIQPGVKVYFDLIASGNGDAGTPGNPTSKVDLIVHGKLIAKGTATSRVLLSSIMSLGASSSVDPWLPSAGDWGSIFTDSKSASVVDYCQIEYGRGCWSRNTNRPYYTNNIFRMNSVMYEKPWGAIYFEQPKGDAVTPRIMIKSNTISGGYEGIVVYATDSTDPNYGPARTGDLIVDPYIAYNNIKADYCLDLEVWDSNDTTGNGSGYVRGSVIGNKLWSWGNEPVYLYADAYDNKNAKISTAFSGNTITSQNDYGVYAYSYASEYGKAYVAPTFSSDKINSYSQTMYAYAYSIEDTTAAGLASITPRFTNCQLSASDDDGMYLYAYSYNEGAAVASPVFVGGSLETANCEGLDAEAYSDYGDASASPSFTNVYGGGHNSCEFLYLYAYSYDDGTAKANPRWVGGKIINLDDAAVYAYAESYEATAEAKPYVANALIQGYDAGFECYAYANYNGDGKGTADVSGTFINATIRVAYVDYNSSGYSGYYGYADSGYRGAAKASPTFNNCDVRALSTHGVEAYAYSDDGAATASPVVTNDSFIEGYVSALYAYAERGGDTAGTSGNCVASPRIADSVLFSSYDVALYAEAYGYAKGDAIVAPSITYSNIENHYYDGAMGLYAYKSSGATGTASVAPYVAGSYLFGADDYVVEPESDGPGIVAGGGVSDAKVAGTYVGSTLESDYYDCISGTTYNYGGSASFTPLVQDCVLIATDDNVVDYDVVGYGTASHSIVNSPTFIRCNMTRSANALDLKAEVNDFASLSPAVCGPVVRDSSIYSTWDDAIDSNAYSRGNAPATNNTYIYNTTMKAYYGVANDATADGAGKAVNNAKVLGKSTSARATIESFSDDAIINYTASANGPAIDNTQSKYLNLLPHDSGVDCDVQGATEATMAAVISGNVLGLKWTGQSDGISVQASGNETVLIPSITSNSIGAFGGNGIYVYNSSGDTKYSPTISANTIGGTGLGVGDDGIYLNNNYSTLLPGSMATVSKNSINYPYGNGIELMSIENALVQGNKISFAAYDNSSLGWYDTGGIYWYGAAGETSATIAQVKGNVVTDARTGVIFEDGWATTQYNYFKDSLNRTNRPWNLGTNKGDTLTPKLDARFNWWGTTSSAAVSETINVWKSSDSSYVAAGSAVDYSSPLTAMKPKVTSITKSKSGSTYTFKVTFDRAMDTSVKYLKFGKSSPYTTYKTKTGTWSNGDKTLTVKFTGAPAAGRYYFSGAKDLPGTAMNSTSKYISLP